MPIIDEVAEHVQVRGPQCTIAEWLKNHTEYTSQDLKDSSRELGQAAVLRFLKSKDFKGGASSLQRHIRSECACPA